MAFVYKSERDVNPIPISVTGDLGPGQYLPQGLIGTKNFTSKVGFDSNTYREMKISKNENPGPGAYEKNDQYEKFADLLKDKPYKSPSLLKSLELVGPDNLDPFAIIINKEKSKDVAFYSKERRFKESLGNESPGPAEYGYDPRFIVKNSIKKRNKKGFFNKQKNISLIRQDKSPISPFRHISIPSKNLCYGFEVNQEGNLYVKDDPDKDVRYNGEKNDCVGPGSYEINMSKKWNKGSIPWEKMSKNIRNSENTFTEMNKRDSLKFDINTTDSNNKVLHTGTPINKKNLSNKLAAFTNIGNKMISNKNEEILSSLSNKQNKEKLFKHFKEKRQKLLDMKTSKNLAEDELFDKHILNQEPGPGYYLSDLASTAFKPIKVPERFQYFGSNSLRFDTLTIPNNEEVGPGLYFKDDNKFSEEKKKKFMKENNNYFHNSANLRDEIKKNRGDSLDDRLGIHGVINQYKLANVEYSPGPGNYDINKDNFNKNPSSNVAQFGSLQKRFVENNIISTPGPGSYIGVPKIESINSIKFPIKPPKKNKIQIEGSKNELDLVPKDPKDESKIFNSPGVGSYNIDIINSVGYKIAKNVNKFNNSSAPFNSVEKRFNRNFVIKTENLGPGEYYKDDSEKNLLKNQMSISPPFNIGSDRKAAKKIIQDNGPGSYNLSSYFDWNKKSYNVQFI